MQHNIVEIDGGVARMPEFRMKNAVSVSIPAGEPLAIVGLNGSGKTMLVDILTGKHPLLMIEPKYDFSPHEGATASDNIRVVTFRDAYGGSEGFYQLRWNHGLQEDSLTVEEMLQRSCGGRAVPREIADTLCLAPLMGKHTIMLSSGELRRVQIAEMLQSLPALLIIDNPYIGLDVEARRQTTEFLSRISQSGRTTVVVVVSRAKDIPPFVDKVLPVREGREVMPIMKKDDFLRQEAAFTAGACELEPWQREAIRALPDTAEAGGPVVECRDISVGYGNRRILSHFSWTVKGGEHWALSGENGAGKSTLLSLICADNPQAYACDISLFGMKRGSGESIWDIKKRIGYVSPELFRAYRKNTTVARIAASGLYDNGSLFRNVSGEDMAKVMLWLRIFGIEGMAERNYLKLSSGEQRLVLLARAFVKDPELLVLDEPFHGLDDRSREMARAIISEFCSRRGKTLIMVSHYEEEYPSIIDHHLRLKKIN